MRKGDEILETSSQLIDSIGLKHPVMFEQHYRKRRNLASFHTRSGCTTNFDVDHSKETTFTMMVLILMIPQFMSLIRACWRSLCSEFHPWPTNVAILWVIMNKKNVNLQEAVGIPISLLLVSLAWSKQLQTRQVEPRKNENSAPSNNRNGSLDEDEIFPKATARDKSTIISSIVKLVATPFVSALFCYVFDVADLANLNNGFLRFDVAHTAFPHFMAQILTSIVGSVLDAFLEQSLLLNRKNQATDDSKIIRADVVKKSRVYICTTMYHENKTEMEQLLRSLHDIDTARLKSERNFESHIFFDGAVKGNVLNDFVLQLIALVPKTLGVEKIEDCKKIKTPYGMQLKWELPGGMPFYIHLKDNFKVKNKKRWSQAMYMSYVLDYKKASMESDPHNEAVAGSEHKEVQIGDDNITYILATDADVRFTHESVEALLDLMMRDQKVGAVCGRTHPLGSGPVVWYQVFDYAIGHWFQKVANHVLGSVLCSPGCFSVYRARAIRDVLPIYASPVETSIDFLTKDMGEDRWMCTLMVQSGWRLEYCAAAEDSTFCPDTFDEFFNQRRRWIPSTLVNLIQLIREWKFTVENNDKISIFFILYQALLVVSTLISPATVILVITGALKYSKLPGTDNDVAILILLCVVTFGFALICLYTKQSFQLKVAKVLTIMFALLMTAVTVGMAAQIAIDLSKRSQCDAKSKLLVKIN
ncbi:Chitin synthase 6 [Exaiptasia diaphana]|nr:Chitin synthase 6 [Exaiptasia diaphana]